jgi:hypothetical protein
VPPTNRPLPRFIAEPPHELEPYGRWGERLGEAFLAACAAVDEAPSQPEPDQIAWYPERCYGERTYVPATVPAGPGLEFFGYVSFAAGDGEGEPSDFRAVADFTDETAEQNLHWKLDLSDEVIGRWRGPGEARGDITLVWGVPLGGRMAGATAATAELDDETVDQCALGPGHRFTLVALDAVHGSVSTSSTSRSGFGAGGTSRSPSNPSTKRSSSRAPRVTLPLRERRQAAARGNS